MENTERKELEKELEIMYKGKMLYSYHRETRNMLIAKDLVVSLTKQGASFL
jgi:hypothetical protein